MISVPGFGYQELIVTILVYFEAGPDAMPRIFKD